MSTILSKTVDSYKINAEIFNSSDECVRLCRERKITDDRFNDMQDDSRIRRKSGWYGNVKSYDETLNLLHTGYQATVDSMKGLFKANVSGEGKRFSFQNNISGFAPVVPLALKGVPNCMLDMRMKPIKAKVVDVYMDMTCSAGTDSDDIVEASKKVLAAVIELERQGYRFNVYVGTGYFDSNGGDVVAVKVKSAEQPLDLKRISFPMTHPAFFRVIGFDWYSKFPLGKYRGGYGWAAWHEFHDKTASIYRRLFSKPNMVFFSIQEIQRGKDKDTIIKEVLESGKCKNKQ